MARLRHHDLRSLLDVVRDCYRAREPAALPRHLVSILPAAVPADILAHNELDLDRGRSTWTWNPDAPPSPALQAAFDRHMQEHPLVRVHAAMAEGERTLKISDFLTRRQFHDLGLYQEFFRHVDVEHQMVMALRVGRPLLIGMAFNRALADFSERERTLLDLLRPHVVQAHANAEALGRAREAGRPLGQALEALSRGVVLLGRDGQVRFASPRAEQWLEAYFPGRRPRWRLPEAIAVWLADGSHRLVATDGLPLPLTPLAVERGDSWLVVRRLEDDAGTVLVLEERCEGLHPSALETLGLTAREAQVLTWVARGKTNGEIALILGIRPKTVGKHLEHVFQKLGVETRTAAVAVLMERGVAPGVG